MSKITDLLDINVFETVVGFASNIPLIYGVASIVFLNIRGDAESPAYYIPSIFCIIVWVFFVENLFGIPAKIV